MSNVIDLNARRLVCPACSSTDVWEWIFGDANDLWEHATRGGKGIYGGNLIPEDAPRWICRKCQHNWGRYAERGEK